MPCDFSRQNVNLVFLGAFVFKDAQHPVIVGSFQLCHCPHIHKYHNDAAAAAAAAAAHNTTQHTT